jgi:hypothetical protein
VSITGFDVLNINAGAPLTAMAGNGQVGMVTLAANAQPGSTLTINDAVTADGPAVLTGTAALNVNAPVMTNNNQPITLNGDTMSLAAAVNAGAGVVTILPVTLTLGIDLGLDSGSSNLVLTSSDLNNIVAGTLRIGDALTQTNTGDIQLTAAVTLSGVSTLALSTGAPGAITDTSGSTLTVTNLALLASNGIGDSSNPFRTAVSTLAFNNTASNSVQISNAGDLTLDAVDQVPMSGNQGPTTTLAEQGALQVNGTIITPGTLTLGLAASGPATEGVNGSIQAGGLLLTGTGATGTFILDSSQNQVAILAANTAAAIIFQDNAALTVGTVAGMNGVTSSNGNITLCSLAGNLTLNQPVNAGIEMVRLSSAGSVTATAAITAGDLGVLSTGLIDLCTVANTVTGVFAAQNADTTASSIRFLDNVSFTVGTVTADPVSPACFAGATGVVTTAGGAISLRSVTGDLILNQAVTSGTMMNHGTVRLDSGGGVTQNAAGAITAGDLGVIAVGPVALAGATNTVTGVFAAMTTGANGTVMFQNAGNITLGVVMPDAPCFLQMVAGVVSMSDITLCGGILAIDQSVNSVGGTVRLSSVGGVVTQTAPITSVNLGVQAPGPITLNLLGNHVTGTFAAFNNSPFSGISFVDSSGFLVDQVSGNSCFQAVTGISSFGDITLHATQGSVTQTAAGAIIGTNLGVVAGGLIDLCVSANNRVSGTFAANDTSAAVGPVRFQDTVSLTVGTFGGATGVVTNAGGDITLNAATGSLTLNQPVTSGTGAIHGTVRLTAVGGNVNQTTMAAVITAMDLGVRAGGSIVLGSGSSVSRIFAAIAANGTVSFNDVLGFQVDTVGSDSCFTQVMGVTGGMTISLISGGNLLITQSIIGGAAIQLIATGTVTQTVAGPISGTDLAVLSTGLIDLCVALNTANTFTATDGSATASAILFQDTSSFMVVGSSGVVTNAGGDITLRTGGNLVVDAPVMSGTMMMGPHGTVRLFALQSVTQNLGGSIMAANLGVIAGGSISLSAVANPPPINVPINVVTGMFAAQDYGAATTSPLSFGDSTSFTVGTVSADPIHPECFAGAIGATTASNNTITLSLMTVNTPLVLTVNQPINAQANGTITVNVGTTNSTTARITVTFNYDPMNLQIFNATLTAMTATVQDTTNGNPGALVMSYAGVTTTWDVTMANMGTVTNPQIVVPTKLAFQNFANLTGGLGADTFVFEDAGYVTGNVDGVEGLNTLDFRPKTFPIIVHLNPPGPFGFSGTTTVNPPPPAHIPPIGGMFFNIGQIFNNNINNNGPTNGSTLIGPDADTNWTINAQNAGYLISQGFILFFTGFPNLTGGNRNDVFTLVTDFAGLTGQLDGGDAINNTSNTLRYSDALADMHMGYYFVNVTLTRLGSKTGFDGTDGGVIIDQGFKDINNLDGGYALAGNSLTGADLSTAMWNVYQVPDHQYPAGNLGGNYTTGGRTLFFSRFQTLNGGAPGNTFNLSSSPMGVMAALNGSNVHNDAFNVGVGPNGSIIGLDNVQGPVNISGSASGIGFDQAPMQPLSVMCPPRSFSQMLPVGDVLTIEDRNNHTAQPVYTLDENSSHRMATFTRSEVLAPGLGLGPVSFVAVQTVNLNAGGGGNNVIQINDTYDYVINTVSTYGVGGNAVTVSNTGAGSMTTIQGVSGDSTVTINATGNNSGTDVRSGPGANTVNLYQPPLPPGAISSSGMQSGVLLEGNPMGSTKFNVFLATFHPTSLVQITGSANDTLTFPDFSMAQYFLNQNMIFSKTTGQVVLCFSQTVNVPQRSFTVSSYLIPSGNPLVKPTIQLFVGGGPGMLPTLFSPAFLNNAPFAPVIAQPTFNSQFGYSPPTVAVADVNGDGVPDLIVAMGSGFEPLVTIFDGNSIFVQGNAMTPTILAQFFAFDSQSVAGVYVAAGNLFNKAAISPFTTVNPTRYQPDIIVGNGRGGAPLVQVFEYNNTFNPFVFPGGGVFLRNSFLAYEGSFQGGVRVTAGNTFFGENHDDIITAPGPGRESDVVIWNAVGSPAPAALFNAYPGFFGGVFIAAGSYLNRPNGFGLKLADILTGPGAGGAPIVNVFRADALAAPIFQFMAFQDYGIAFQNNASPPRFVNGTDALTAGVSSVAFAPDQSNSQQLDIVVGSGEGRPDETQILANGSLTDTFLIINPDPVHLQLTLPYWDPNRVALGSVEVGGYAP